jgi:hypothetical protein
VKIKIIICCACLVLCSVLVNAQQTATPAPATNSTEQSVPLTDRAIALDAKGAPSLTAQLRTTALSGTQDAPAQNLRIVIQNSSPFFYNYVSGWASFYDAQGVRCGEGLFVLPALAPQESAEVDTPGLRVRCAPATWRIVATNLLTRTTDVAKPSDPAPVAPTPIEPATPAISAQLNGAVSAEAQRFVNLSVNGKSYRVPMGSTLTVPVSGKRVKIAVQEQQ